MKRIIRILEISIINIIRMHQHIGITFMDQEDIKDLYQEKYKKRLGMTYEDWQELGPQNETEAYARLQEIEDDLRASYDEWYEAEGNKKEELEEERDKLKAEYDFIEEAFGLEAPDKNW